MFNLYFFYTFLFPFIVESSFYRTQLIFPVEERATDATYWSRQHYQYNSLINHV